MSTEDNNKQMLWKTKTIQGLLHNAVIVYNRTLFLLFLFYRGPLIEPHLTVIGFVYKLLLLALFIFWSP